MLRSMTGFGLYKLSSFLGKITVEVQSVNHRQLEVYLQLPREFSSFEWLLKKQIGEFFHRGSIGVRIRVEWNEKKHLPQVSLFKKIKKEWESLANSLGYKEPLEFTFLWDRVKELGGEAFLEDQKKVEALLVESLEKALKKTDSMRLQEGAFLQKKIEEALLKVDSLLHKIGKKVPLFLEKQKKELQEKVASFLHSEKKEEALLVREVATFFEKKDVTEEIHRLSSHIKQFQKSLEKESFSGKKLGFLVQEMMREAGTICAKSSSSEIISFSVEMKGEIEKIKEQVANIE